MLFLIRPMLTGALVVGLILFKRQRNKLRRALVDVKEELTTAKVQCAEQTHRAVRAEEMLNKLLPKVATSTSEVEILNQTDDF